jgi:hypothetical protein
MNDNNDTARALRPRPAPLPTEISDWEKARKVKVERTLNDNVEDIHLNLLNHGDVKRREKYKGLLDAVYDEDAVEGSLAADNFLVATMIRDYAREDNHDPYVANKKLATLIKALGVVLRRYGWSRSQRARTVGGELVPKADVNGNE